MKKLGIDNAAQAQGWAGPTLLKVFISSIYLECEDYHPI